jgi:threonylcarbamoyladenosine tRNA methylthiotransferase MtaB
MKSFYLRTFGCKLNQADSAAVRGALLRQGLREAAAPEEADLIVVNTCTVTHKADHDARQSIRRLKAWSPNAKLIVTGCYAERDAELLAAMPEVDQVFGLSNRRELFQFTTGIDPDDPDFGGPDFEADFGEKTRAFLKVQEGCDMLCSFCIIRVVRGASRSLPAEEVVGRLRALADRGYREVVLTGIHLGLWGRDLGIRGVGKGMLHLLRAIEGADGMPRIRLNSLEPYVVRDEILDLIAGSDRFAHHLHLSIQSGSERILRLMRRRPDVERFYHVTRRARELMPEIGIGADIIVGFPGEIEEDFQATYHLMTEAPFSYGHVFSFSPRPGTEAATMPDQINPAVIGERSARLRAALAAINLRFRHSLIDRTMPAVFLRQRDDNGLPTALTDNYLHVSVARGSVPSTGAGCVRIIEADGDRTVGEAA